MTADLWDLRAGTLGLSAVLVTSAIAAMAFIAARSSLVGGQATRSWG